ncbi:MAG: type II secretion system F family protein [Acidobacteria bacterium]|nr:type II secretion system F family protein [Acidobacteriota bacterium]
MNMTLLLATIAVTVFLTLLLVVLLVGGRSPEHARLMEATRGGGAAAGPVERPMEGPRWRPLLSMEELAKAAGPIRRLLGSREDSEVAQRLATAGYRRSSHADAFYVVKILLPLVGAVAAALLFKENMFFWVVVAAASGFMFPDLWLSYAVGQRRDRIRLSLPDALDLLVICMEAGLGLDQAMVRVGQEMRITHVDLSDEFLLVNLEQRAGKPRLEAWRKMADRTNVDSVRQFVHMLAQTERFGTPISKSLGAFADALRVRRRQQAEEMAAKTTIKMIPPLVFFIFPSLFIVLLGPAVITIVRNLNKLVQ